MNLGGPSETLLGKIAEGAPVQNAGLSYIAGVQQRQKEDASNADRILKAVYEISKYDAPTATKILQEEAKRNPKLAAFGSVQFKAETKNDYITATIVNEQGEQETRSFHISVLGMLKEAASDEEAREIFKKNSKPFGWPTAKKEPKSIANINPSDFTPKSVQKYNETGNYSDLVPAPKKAAEESTTNIKEWKFNNQQRKQQGLPELTFEQYRQQMYELNDPFGVKRVVRDKLNKDKEGTTGTYQPSGSGIAAPQGGIAPPAGFVLEPTKRTKDGKLVYKNPKTGQLWAP